MIEARFLLRIPRAAKAKGFPVVVDRPDAVVPNAATLWIAERTPTLSLGENGLVLGILFDSATFRRADRETCVEALAATAKGAARELLAGFWGAYLAMIREPGEGSLALLADPSGLLPVYRLTRSRDVVLTTDPALLDVAPSYRDIGSHLLRPELRHRRTCLTGVDELPPGSLLSLDAPDEAPRQIWQANRFVPDGSVRTFDSATQELRALSSAVLGSWAGVLGQVGVAASGGVDSSLVCAALSDAGARFDCITVATADPSGDERRHARSVARQLGVRCVEREFDDALFDPCQSASRGLARPSRRSFLAMLDALLDDARAELGAGVVMDGNNGDNLFCFLHSSTPVVDRFRAEGVGRGLGRTLVDMCQLTGCSVPTMLAASARRLAGRARRDPWPADTRLLARDVAHAGAEALTPWLDGCSDTRSGAHDHLALLMHAQNHVHGITGPLARFSPLASQPLVEFCLGVPSWLWAHGGRNRALARAAFADRLPPEVVARTSKAGPDSFIRIAFARNREAIGEHLQGGLLAAHGLLDRAALDSALRVDEFGSGVLVDRILDLLEAENWARSWSR